MGLVMLKSFYQFPTLLKGVRMCSTISGRLSGRVAIVTASTDGIGYAIARRLGQDGAKVMISSRKQDNVDKAVAKLTGEGLNVTGMVCHVGKDEHRKSLIEQTVKQHGGLDILVSNAAVNPYFGTTLGCPEQAWDKILDVNIKSTALLTKEAAPHLEATGNGSIVLVSSIAGYHPFEMLGPYSVSKTALLGLTKVLAKECAPMGIRVNCIAPGLIETKFSEMLLKNDDIKEMALSVIPMKRFGVPDDCSGVVSFLCSDDSSYITGETILVTGGLPSKL